MIVMGTLAPDGGRNKLAPDGIMPGTFAPDGARWCQMVPDRVRPWLQQTCAQMGETNTDMQKFYFVLLY
jgi:hypothetical protein